MDFRNLATRVKLLSAQQHPALLWTFFAVVVVYIIANLWFCTSDGAEAAKYLDGTGLIGAVAMFGIYGFPFLTLLSFICVFCNKEKLIFIVALLSIGIHVFLLRMDSLCYQYCIDRFWIKTYEDACNEMMKAHAWGIAACVILVLIVLFTKSKWWCSGLLLFYVVVIGIKCFNSEVIRVPVGATNYFLGYCNLEFLFFMPPYWELIQSPILGLCILLFVKRLLERK